jgi:hypothetical protein
VGSHSVNHPSPIAQRLSLPLEKCPTFSEKVTSSGHPASLDAGDGRGQLLATALSAALAIGFFLPSHGELLLNSGMAGVTFRLGAENGAGVIDHR